MKIADGLKMIENGWIRKPEGFRVRFHRQTNAGLEAGLSPPHEAAPLNSDVTAWRYAWKLGRPPGQRRKRANRAPFTTSQWWTTRIVPSDSMAAAILRPTTRSPSMVRGAGQPGKKMKPKQDPEGFHSADRYPHLRMHTPS